MSNKSNAEIRGIVERCFERVGGEEQFAAWAKANPHEFYTKIWAKIIPRTTAITDERAAGDSMRSLTRAELDELAKAHEQLLRERLAERGGSANPRPN